MSSFVLQQKRINFKSKALQRLGEGNWPTPQPAAKLPNLWLYTHVWVTLNSSYLCNTIPERNTIRGSTSCSCGVWQCALVGQNTMGDTAPAPGYSVLNSSFAIRQRATLVPIRGAEEGEESTFTLCYLGLQRDLRLLDPCCKFFVVKMCNSVSLPCRSPGSGDEVRT